MRQLLNTLFVTSEDIYLSLDGENVVASREHQEAARYPLHTLSGIVSFSYPGASPALMGACAERGLLHAARAVSGPDRREYLGKRPAPACPVPHGGRALRQLPHCPQYDLRQGL